MFKRRVSKLGRAFLVASLFFMGGMQQSCKDWLDDYKYDDSEPEWLGASVYAFLQEGTPSHSYRNYVELIDSLGEKAALEKTGSKTLFVADDAAFERFYATNPWGVKSVAEMSVAQRKYLFYNTMLSNAVLLDMMPNTSESSTGDRLSRNTEFNVLDSVPVVHPDYYPEHPSWPTYNKYWDHFTDGKDSLKLALTSSSMVHFFDDYLKTNAISVSDVNFVFQKSGKATSEYKKGDVLLYGNKLVDSEVDAGTFSEDSLTIVCKNGYVYRMDEVLLPPMDMASELRYRKDTRIFSHLLDRFCIPVLDNNLTNDYRIHHNVQDDSIYSLLYFTSDGFPYNSYFNGKTGVKAPESKQECLRYNPAKSKGESDIYAMLVPKDEHLYEYFANEEAAGNFLIKNYAPDVNVDPAYSEEGVATLLAALDSIPQLSIATFLNNLMQSSFVATVPSKFDRVTDDANDDMNIQTQHVDECVIANNGVLYLLNKVFSPAQFSSVSGPVDIYANMSIMRRFISDLKYNYYLLAMDADYSLIVPDNGNFVYFDPVTYGNYSKEGKMKMYSFHHDDKRKGSTKTELWYEEFEVDDNTFKIDTLLKQTNISDGTDVSGVARIGNIAKDLLEYLIIVHDKVEPEVHKDRLYYSTKGYGTVKIDASDPECIKFYGGEQLEKGTEIVSSMIVNQLNGTTYCTEPAVVSEDTLVKYSSIPTPPTKSVYDNMNAYAKNESDLFYEFYQLCNPGVVTLENILKKADPENSTVAQDTMKLYSIFYTDGKTKNCVPFFNTYHYTVYVPSNESVKEVIEMGLPTWEVIEAEVEKNPLRAMAMLRQVNSFVRYHFQDQSIYYDRSPFFVPNVDGGKDYVASFSTSLINPVSGRFYELVVKSDDTNSTILIQDEWAKLNKVAEARIMNTEAEEENKTWNVMCRDRVGSSNIETSSYSVLQPIDRALLNSNLFGFDGRVQRFATNGCRVDTMYVAGEQFLVADAGRVPFSTKDEPQLAELENKELAYLMKPLSASDEGYDFNISQEELVLDAEGQPILVTRDGYRVNKVEKYGAFEYSYYTEADEAGNEYIIKVNNDGTEVDRTLYKEAEAPEAGEEGSDSETNDEE